MGGQDEEKVIVPMFPRLHVNDKEKGGLRPPPRNKMALYEQLSIPSQRFSSGSASMLPLLHNNRSISVTSMFSNHDGGHERNSFTSRCNSPAPSDFSDKLHSYSSNGVQLSTMMESRQQKSMKPTFHKSVNATGPLSSTATCNSFQPYNFSNFKKFSLKRLEVEDGHRVPFSAQPGITPRSSNSQHGKDEKNLPRSNVNSSMHLHTTFEKRIKGLGNINLKPTQFVQNQAEYNPKMYQSAQVDVEISALVPSTSKRNLVDDSSGPSSKVNNSKSLKRLHASWNEETKSSSEKIIHSLDGTMSHQDCVSLPDETAPRENVLMEPTQDIGKGSASKVRNDPCLRPIVGDKSTSPNELENGGEYGEDKNCWSIQVKDLERPDGDSNNSMVDSISVVNVSPDDVVGAIGQKQFWKARRAIVNQQRLFAMQVFELHRLIKVQRLIAGLPHLLLKDKLIMGKPSVDVFPVKKLTPDDVLKPPAIAKPVDYSQKPNPNNECEDENAVPKLHVPSVNNDTSKRFVTQHSSNEIHSGSTPPTNVTTHTKLPPWCFTPPGNQWLVPVMSPSEGLVYKPYTGQCPPTTGFMAPGYGSFGPMSLTLGGEEFLNVGYGVPASHRQGFGIVPGPPLPMGQTYCPPYCMPFMNPSISSSTVDQVSPFAGALSKENQLSMGDVSISIPHQSSSDMSGQMIKVISCHVGKFHARKENEVQGSTASSPCARTKGDELPLFPTEPAVQALDGKLQIAEQQTRAIKVVPHNPKSATESAARIFQSIQEERKHSDQLLI
ncbi:hypothetical protein CFOL_v3_18721 [Cephalotus follicularis]|uniref:Uncharacterized protein n=1 Tax=Cephalotus follicularis TaxID=3775 RepID=A0A1Q3C5A2_CEPFO|nr:hypothetical protein CFOL_v3_18721 [Cephalotus follicularis]